MNHFYYTSSQLAVEMLVMVLVPFVFLVAQWAILWGAPWPKQRWPYFLAIGCAAFPLVRALYFPAFVGSHPFAEFPGDILSMLAQPLLFLPLDIGVVVAAVVVLAPGGRPTIAKFWLAMLTIVILLVGLSNIALIFVFLGDATRCPVSDARNVDDGVPLLSSAGRAILALLCG